MSKKEQEDFLKFLGMQYLQELRGYGLGNSLGNIGLPFAVQPNYFMPNYFLSNPQYDGIDRILAGTNPEDYKKQENGIYSNSKHMPGNNLYSVLNEIVKNGGTVEMSVTYKIGIGNYENGGDKKETKK